jgi:hypothetical protein
MSKVSSALERCTEETRSPRVTVKANGRAATFLNLERTTVKKVDVDCWLQSTSEVRSDYLLTKPAIVDVIIELKGKDIDHAVAQILATLSRWRATKGCSPKFGGLVVFTRSPKRSAALDNLKLKLLNSHQIWIEMGKSGLKDYEFATFTGTKR